MNCVVGGILQAPKHTVLSITASRRRKPGVRCRLLRGRGGRHARSCETGTELHFAKFSQCQTQEVVLGQVSYVEFQGHIFRCASSPFCAFARGMTTNGHAFRRTFEFRRIFFGFKTPRLGCPPLATLAQTTPQLELREGWISSTRILGVVSNSRHLDSDFRIAEAREIL